MQTISIRLRGSYEDALDLINQLENEGIADKINAAGGGYCTFNLFTGSRWATCTRSTADRSPTPPEPECLVVPERPQDDSRTSKQLKD